MSKDKQFIIRDDPHVPLTFGGDLIEQQQRVASQLRITSNKTAGAIIGSAGFVVLALVATLGQESAAAIGLGLLSVIAMLFGALLFCFGFASSESSLPGPYPPDPPPRSHKREDWEGRQLVEEAHRR